MFESIRKHTKVMGVVLFVLIIPSFVLIGLQGYNRLGEGGEVVAKVDGREITQAEWENAHRRQVDELRQQMPELDVKMLDTPAARYGTLERMVRERVIAAAAEDANLMVSDQRVARELQTNELIAALRGPDGRLDLERYRQLLANQGLTPEMFENQVRGDIAMRQVLGGVTQSAFTPRGVAGVALESYFQRREVQVARFDASDYRARVQPTEAELQAFYKDNPQMFRSSEQADIEYAVLDASALQGRVAVNEADLRTYYEQNAGRLAGQEERRASHILIAVPRGAPQEEKDKARARAEELLAQIRSKPDSFAELARQHSQDPGSAAQGGDLDFFARGAMTKPFEDAVFALQNRGDLSEVVESDFGYHIIRLTDLKTPQQRSFEDMRAEIEADLRRQQAQRQYAEAAENFSNTVYEQSDSLRPAADKLKLEIRTAKGVTRTPAPDATGPLASPKFLEAVFSQESVERRRNTEAVEFGPSQMAAARIVQYQPARTRPFEEVKEQVRERVVATQAAALAEKEGKTRLDAWMAAPGSAELPPAVVLARQDAGQQPPSVVEAAMRADPARLPALVGVDLGLDGYAVVRVNRVLPREAPGPEQTQQELAQYTRAWATSEALAYYELLKDRFKAQIRVRQPREGQAQ